jgi:hypothetical protein
MPAEGSVRVLSWPAKREAASGGTVAGVASEPRGTTMHDGFEVSVTFDPAKGYAATAPELREPVLALSLGGVRRRVEALLLPDDLHVVLQLDVRARHERDRRRHMSYGQIRQGLGTA